jgi:hypothetical protein
VAEDLAAIVLAEIQAEDLAEEDPEEEADLETEILEVLKEEDRKCMKLLAINAENNVKFHLNLQEINLFIAVNVLKKMILAEVQVQDLAQEVQDLLLQQECLQNNSSKLV